MCNNDALTMVGEGRAYAAVWMKEVAGSLDGAGKADLAALARKAAESFDGEYALVKEIFSMPEYRKPGEKQALALAKPEFRKKLVERIGRAAELDRAAAVAIRELLARWK
jgi:hypothetical protein